MRTALALAVAAGLAGPWASAAPRLKEPPAEPLTIVGERVQDDGGRRHEFTEGGAMLVGQTPAPRPPRYVVNAQTNPAAFDLTHPGERAATWLGICKAEGDTLTICLSMRAGDPRPTKFERSADPPVLVQTYTRVKSKDGGQ
jgi:uncharacterized protein (TIGR03067 family)